MKLTFISWTKFDRRADLLARHLGASVHFISYGRRGSLWQAPLRYAVQSARTWRVLRRERPDVVFVQNPPIVAVWLAWLYARQQRARYIIDSHSAAFLSPKWRWSLALHRLLARRALATVVTNTYLEAVVRGWGCPAIIVAFSPDNDLPGRPFPVAGPFNVAVVSSGAEDEPLDVVFAAAARLPSVQFYVTGDSSRIDGALLARRPGNCLPLGYVPYEEYVGLLQSVDVVMDLTKRDHTLLMGAFEAVSVGTPLIVSDWPLLRTYFRRGTVHVANTVEAVCEGVERARRELATLREEVLLLREELSADWQRRFGELQRLLGEAAREQPPAEAETGVSGGMPAGEDGVTVGNRPDGWGRDASGQRRMQ